MGCNQSSPKREVYSNTILPQETLNRQPNFTPKTTGKRRTTKKKLIEAKKSWRSEQNKWKRNERNNSKD